MFKYGDVFTFDNYDKVEKVVISGVGGGFYLFVYKDSFVKLEEKEKYPNLDGLSLYLTHNSRMIKKEGPKAIPGRIYINTNGYEFVGLENGSLWLNGGVHYFDPMYYKEKK